MLSQRAQGDIDRLHQFLRAKDIRAAQRAVQAIRAAFAPLVNVPMMGRPVEGHAGLRELVIDFGASGYLAAYHYLPPPDQVVILAIKHQREDDYK